MTRRRLVRVAAVVLVGLVLSVGLIGGNLAAIVDWSMTPNRAFDANAVPAPPRYDDDTHWSALPNRADSADQTPEGIDAIDPRAAAVDVFYLHPTSYVGSEWNAPVDDAKLNADTDRVATGLQASAFNGCCAVYAPRYRQANGTSFYRPSDDGEHAMDLAYRDVRAAFDAFQARRGAHRPFILASHSQGSFHAERLLEEIAAQPKLRERLVVAYLIGGVLTVEGLRQRMPPLHACQGADDLGCVVAYQARSPTFVPTRFELRGHDTRERLCVNPLSWRQDDVLAPASRNLGAVFLESSNRAPRAAFADARCVQGVLQIAELGTFERDLPSRILDHVLGVGNYHSIEVQLFYMNLRRNAEARCAAWQRKGP